MLKIFTTQLTGLFNGILKREEFGLEDAARLLSQALIGDGHVYVFGKDEMAAVVQEAIAGKERLSKVKPLIENGEIAKLHSVDRVLLISRTSADDDILTYAKKLYDMHIPFVAISSVDENEKRLLKLADVHLNLKVTNSLVPMDDGNRIGYPASLVALYTYFCLYCLIKETMDEYNKGH